MRTIQNLEQNILHKDQVIAGLEQQLKRKDLEEDAFYQAQMKQIELLQGELDTKQALLSAKDRRIAEAERGAEEKARGIEAQMKHKMGSLEAKLDHVSK